MRGYRKYRVIGGISIFVVIGIVILALFVKEEEQKQLSSYGAGEVPQAVLQYQTEIEEELEKYGLEEHI
ncbi:MAG: hypothetical protein L0I93_01940, partial [Atopostipes suicloacalis]|nr:hypothetical protein [Atopostipes suicloacalis]